MTCSRFVASVLSSAFPIRGDDSPGWYGAVFLLDLLPFFTEHRDGLVGQPGDLLRGGLDRVGPDQLSVPGDDGLCLSTSGRV